MTPPAPAPHSTASARPLGGIAAGLALVLVAVLIGAAAQRVTTPQVTPVSSSEIAWNGRTTTVKVTAEGMRFRPDTITVPAGDRLIIELANKDRRRHDLALATGPKSPILASGDASRLDAGVIGGTVEGWCSLPGHRQAGMRLTITTTGNGGSAAATGHDHAFATAATTPSIDAMAEPGAGFVARDATAPLPPTGRLHRLDLRVQEVQREVAPGVRQKMWTFNGTTPAPCCAGASATPSRSP